MKESYRKDSSLRELIQMSLRYKGVTFSVVGSSIILSLAAVYRPKLIQQAIDDHMAFKNFEELNSLLIIIVLLLLLESLFHFILVYLSNLLAQNVIRKIRTELFEKLLGFKTFFFQKTPIGLLITRSVSDVETVATVFNDGLFLIFGDILRIIIIIVMMYTMHSMLASLTVLTIPFMYLITKYFQKALKKTFQEERIQTSQLNSFAQERISGMHIVQLFHREAEELKKFKKINCLLTKAHFKTIFYFSLFFPVVELLSAITIGTLITYGGWSAITHGDVKAGQIIAFIFFTYMLFRPMRQMADRFNTIQRGLTGTERVFKLLQTDESLPDKGRLRPIRIKGHIVFDRVHFSYTEGEPVLKNLSFEIKPGEKVAIVGETGTGKSTIVQLISRLYEIDRGNIYIDGYRIETFELENLRRHIRIMTQETFLFNDSILNNVTLGAPDINLEIVQKNARKIGIHDFITLLPQGYNQLVQERGYSLSMGERQLIALLRILLHPYSILVLDEATASVDDASEKLIYQATRQLSEDKTSIIIAHRLSTIQNADKILVIHNGTLVEEGTHTSLLRSKGHYSKLYQAQYTE
ncbi:MAG: ABC transporter ATP-binding protein [Flavobacteriales bacterium Tduv]